VHAAPNKATAFGPAEASGGGMAACLAAFAASIRSSARRSRAREGARAKIGRSRTHSSLDAVQPTLELPGELAGEPALTGEAAPADCPAPLGAYKFDPEQLECASFEGIRPERPADAPPNRRAVGCTVDGSIGAAYCAAMAASRRLGTAGVRQGASRVLYPARLATAREAPRA
jgi:hypothetical protein